MQRAFGERVAMNAPIQGTAADIIKIAMVRVYRRLKTEVPAARLILQVHDELIVETPQGSAEQVRELVRQEMESAVSLSVPLLVDAKVGKTWGELTDPSLISASRRIGPQAAPASRGHAGTACVGGCAPSGPRPSCPPAESHPIPAERSLPHVRYHPSRGRKRPARPCRFGISLLCPPMERKKSG